MKLTGVAKKLLTSVSGLCALMLITAVVVSSLGTLLTGGLEEWRSVLKNFSFYFLLWRILIYGVLGWFWYAALKTHKQKENQQSVEKMYRLGGIALMVVLFVECSKLWGNG